MFSIRKALACTALTLAAGHASAAALVADGKLDAGYQLGYSIGFIDDKGQAVGDGKLYFGVGADNTQFLYFQMPLNYVDNTYGTNAEGWGNKGHTFNDLVGSDSLGSRDGYFSWNGNDVRIDYIVKEGTAYKSGGVTAGEGTVAKGSASSILEIATSLEYNLSLYPTLLINSGTTADWIKEVGYEIQFKAGTFDPSNWLNPALAHTLISLGSPHASPSKRGFGGYENPECILGCGGDDNDNEVPEPGLPALLALGLGALGWVSRRQRNRAAGR